MRRISATWLPLEYDLQLTHGEKEAKEVPELQSFREAVRQETREKIRQEGRKEAPRKGFYVSKDPKETEPGAGGGADEASLTGPKTVPGK